MNQHIHDLLSRLDKVRPAGDGRWSACCPAHDDKGPSLSIRATDDGKILLHCFSGCSVHEIAGAAGIDLVDLFPPRESSGKPEKNPFPASHALKSIAAEALVIAAAATRLAEGHPDRDRIMGAAAAIRSALAATFPDLRSRHAR